MSYRIIIEDQNGLHQAILNETKEAKDVIHNINNILKMFDLKNADGCDLSVHGNAEKLSQMYDLITKDSCIILRDITAWDNGRGAAHD